MGINSNSSSPKDYQATTRLFSLTLKNLIIYFVNIVDYKQFCLENEAGSQSKQDSAVWNVFSRILVNQISESQTQLISLENIKRYKATNFEDFPECFGHEEWKVTFFHNQEISRVVREQINPQMILENFFKRRETYGKGINEMTTRSEKTKESIHERTLVDTNTKVSLMSKQAHDHRVASGLRIFVLNGMAKQHYAKVSNRLMFNRGLWKKYGNKFLQSTGSGFTGFGVKAFLKERNHNGFKYISKQLDKKLFTQVETDAWPKLAEVEPDQPGVFTFFGGHLPAQAILDRRDEFIDQVKLEVCAHSPDSKEVMRTDCVLMKPFYQAKGSLVLTKYDLFFVYINEPEVKEGHKFDLYNTENLFFFKKKTSKVVKAIDLDGIREVQRRKFIGLKRSLEIFMLDNSSYLVQFPTAEERDLFAKKLVKMRSTSCRNLRYYDSFDPKKVIKKRELTDRWRQWRISNFSYLMHLNYLGGRSQNDLSQYPVFPWILSMQFNTGNAGEVDNAVINQHYARGDAPPAIFRDLSKNMQLLGTAERQAEFKRKFDDIDGFIDFADRFHCGSFYSNPGITLHYLARISPFTDGIVELQGLNHDDPDRVFHSLSDSYHNALKDFSDVREIMPEFFYLPEMYLNLNHIKFGRRQDQELVNHVKLPPQFHQNPFKFVVAMREALESNYVSQNISKWIDYIFGYKQQGPDAERCLNTFSSVTYDDVVDLEKIAETDPHLAESYKLQMYNYGQCPLAVVQFKTKEHPAKKYKEEVFKYNLITDLQANLKVYRPVNKKKNGQDTNKSLVLSQIQQGRLPLIQRKAIIKAQFINEGLIAAARVDGKMRFYMWVN